MPTDLFFFAAADERRAYNPLIARHELFIRVYVYYYFLLLLPKIYT